MLLFDEPTNDLDIETLGILEDYIEEFPGAVIAVSHDRYFLDKIANAIFEVGEDGKITGYSGNFSDYLEKRPPIEETPALQKEKMPKARPQPQRVQKLKLSYKEERELATIDEEIEALEEKLKVCEKAVEEAACDYEKLLLCTEELEKTRIELDEKTERWVYLNELLEKIEAQGK